VEFALESFDPCPYTEVGLLDGEPNTSSLMALDLKTKYQFVDETGAIFHEYVMPSNPELYYLGGYVGKIVYYRDPAMLRYLTSRGVSKASFESGNFPILATQAPQIDLIVFELIRYIRQEFGDRRINILDIGCTVAEHYDLLDTMIKSSYGEEESARSALSYVGLDRSALVLSVAALMHQNSDPAHFQLAQSEGSDFNYGAKEWDLSFSMGVLNHIRDPINTLEEVIRATRYATVLALWVTTADEGFWAINHRGAPFYFFSKTDLRRIESIDGGRFLVANYLPDVGSTQEKSYVGLSQETMRGLGSYHLVYTRHADLPVSFPPIPA